MGYFHMVLDREYNKTGRPATEVSGIWPILASTLAYTVLSLQPP